MGHGESKTDGTQAIRRAALVLRQVAYGAQTGVSLKELSEATGLSRSTAHRIVKALQDEGFLDYDAKARRYVIGDLPFELGLSSSTRRQDEVLWRSTVDALSAFSGATCYLIGRSGSECVCLYKAEGNAVIRAIPVEVGQRRPLGVGAAATALLADASEGDREAVLAAIEPLLEMYPHLDTDRIRSNVRLAQDAGLSESSGQVVDGLYGLGMVLPTERGGGSLAISLAAPQTVVSEAKASAWKDFLRNIRTPMSANS